MRHSWLALLAFPLTLGLWELIPHTGLVSPDLLPPFSAAAAEAWHLIASGEIAPHAAGSLERWLVGFGLSLLLSIPAGIAMGRSEALRNFLDPLLTITYPVPKAAMMPILMLWFGAGDLSKIIVLVIGCAIPLVVSAYHGAQGVEKNLIWSARAMGTSESMLLWRIVLPAALPQILSGVRTALAISLFVMLGSEMIVRQNGLGFYLFNSLDLGLYRLTYATVLLVALFGFALDAGFVALTRKALRWMDSVENTAA